MSEDELLTAITSGTKKNPGLCKLLGVRYFHPYDSRRSVPGFPDLFLVGTDGFAFRETEVRVRDHAAGTAEVEGCAALGRYQLGTVAA